MIRQLRVTYFHHSGFACETDHVLLVFDYWLGEKRDLPERVRLTPAVLSRYEEVYVFISHSHPDHYDPEVLRWRGMPNLHYIISEDVPAGVPGQRLKPNQEVVYSPRVTVRSYDSTDLGLSYFVNVEGMGVFHAGDLNFWHWREDSSVQEIDEADAAFKRCCADIAKEKIDLCFFPVDPRQGQMYDAGACSFIMAQKPRLLIPMHFWGRNELVREFARRARTRDTEIVPLTHPGDRLRMDIAENGFMTVNIAAAEVWEGENAPRVYEDPFADIDVPLDLY